MSVFEDKYKNDQTGRSAYDPKILLKVVLLGYSRGLISSRQIERACCENVTFMALSGNQRPDHSTIAVFVSSMKDQILPLFCDILLVCEQENLLGGSFFALDGLKLAANASKECSGTVSDLKFRTRDSRFATRPRNKAKKGKKFVLQDFKYNKTSDCYICPNGRVLKLNIKSHSKDRNIYRRYMADEKDCKSCSLKRRCFYRKNTKRRSLDVLIGAEKSNFSKAMQNKVDSDKGRKIYPQRFAIVEPVFANIKTQNATIEKFKIWRDRWIFKNGFFNNFPTCRQN
jgi:hypothetical protein